MSESVAERVARLKGGQPRESTADRVARVKKAALMADPYAPAEMAKVDLKSMRQGQVAYVPDLDVETTGSSTRTTTPEERESSAEFAYRQDAPARALEVAKRHGLATVGLDDPDAAVAFLADYDDRLAKIVKEEPGKVRAMRVAAAVTGPGVSRRLIGTDKRDTLAEIGAEQRKDDSFAARLATDTVPAAAGAVGRMLLTRRLGSTGSGFVEGAVQAEPGQEFRQGVKTAALVGAAGRGTTALSKALPGPALARIPTASALAGGAAEAGVEAVFEGRLPNVEQAIESGLMNLGQAIPGLRGAARAEGFGRLRPKARENVMDRRQAVQDAETGKINAERKAVDDYLREPIGLGAEPAPTAPQGVAEVPSAPARADAADPTPSVTAALRGGRKAPPSRPPTLSRFVQKQGGIRMGEILRGETRTLSGKETGKAGVLTRKGRLDVEEMQQSAVESGYDVRDMSPADFIEAVRADAEGSDVYRPSDDYTPPDQPAPSRAEGESMADYVARAKGETETPRRLSREAGFAQLPDVTAPVRAVGRGVAAGIEHVKDSTRQFPRMTRENPAASVATSKAASSHVVAKTLTPKAVRDVVTRHGLDANEFGAALTESNLRGQKDINTKRALESRLEARALAVEARKVGKASRAEGLKPLDKARLVRQADTLKRWAKEAGERAADEAKRAAAIPTMIGGDVRSVASEQAYQDYAARADVRAAVEAHNKFWEAEVHPMWVARQGLEADAPVVHRGRELPARISVLPLAEYQKQQAEMTGDTPPTSARPGSLRNKNITRSGYSNRLVGSKSGYVTDYGEIMASRIHREVFGSAKAEGAKALVDAGDAAIVAPGEKAPTEIKGEPAILITDVLPSRKGTEDAPGVRPKSSLYVRESMATEVKRGWKLVEPSKFGALSKVLGPINTASLTGLADNFINISRGITTPLMRRLSANTARESALNLFLPVQVARHLFRTAKAIRASGKDLDAQVELAKVGALRDYDNKPITGTAEQSIARRALGVPFRIVGRVGNLIDRAARYQMQQVFKENAKAGRWEDTPENLRDFVNQMGNYVRGAQGAFTRTMVETGLGPFTTAKVTRWANRLRTASLSQGAKTTGGKARTGDALELLSKMTGALITLGGVNYMTSGNVQGRPGVPFGSIDTGADDEHGRPKVINFLDMIGLGDIPKMVGGTAYITAKRRGLPEADALTSAVRQAVNQGLTFFSGPGPTAASIFATGKNVFGFPIVPEGPPGEFQPAKRAAGAAFETVPLARVLARAFFPETTEALTQQTTAEGMDVAHELRQQIGFFGTRPGMPADAVADLPERVRGAQMNEWITGIKRRIKNVLPAERRKWLSQQVEGANLSAEERMRVTKELRYSLSGK